MNYLHYNPIKHGLVKQVKDWPYSSFHRYVKNGTYDENWGALMFEDDESFGEV
jgi:putative transposase